ncbi:flagellar hook-length control protein FliK [Simiduia sp. 21SJ11W-1]|uniref:flagellar hook-length control protein FliK n=1 Tax=Simiduia sp. 21SJ11W-1 TaxID=2909669 RepID=UPI00209EFAD6|nr:flagellar hook-length control protein FliK [Simiduia sp. 21SJ11W-1]UTA46527.1 flagellar hook-length control protein FliK [Simiduia sp. 21SJ11W-1]
MTTTTGPGAPNPQPAPTQSSKPLSLAPGTQVWALVASTTPLAGKPELEAAARQRLAQLANQLTTPKNQTPAASQVQADSRQPSLLSAPLYAIQAKVGQRLITLLANQPLSNGQAVLLRATARGFSLAEAGAKPPNPTFNGNPAGTGASEKTAFNSAHLSSTGAPTPLGAHGNLGYGNNATGTQPAQNQALNLLTQVLRQTLPHQTPISPVLAKLALQLLAAKAAATHPSAHSPLQPKPHTPGAGNANPAHTTGAAPNSQANNTLNQTLQQLVGKLLQLGSLPLPPDAKSLKQAIDRSGLFAEAKLHTAPHQAGTDVKLLLWQLAGLTSSKSQPQDLLSQLLQLLQQPAQPLTASAQQPNESLKTLAQLWLNKIVSQQAQSLTEEVRPGEWRANLEIPLRAEQQWLPLHLQLQKYWHNPQDPDQHAKHTAQGTKALPVWQVTLSVEIPTLGNLDARIRYVNERLHFSLWAEQPRTLKLLQAHSHSLGSALQTQGLAVQIIECHPGRLPQTPNTINSPLLDTHA